MLDTTFFSDGFDDDEESESGSSALSEAFGVAQNVDGVVDGVSDGAVDPEAGGAQGGAEGATEAEVEAEPEAEAQGGEEGEAAGEGADDGSAGAPQSQDDAGTDDEHSDAFPDVDVSSHTHIVPSHGSALTQFLAACGWHSCPNPTQDGRSPREASTASHPVKTRKRQA